MDPGLIPSTAQRFEDIPLPTGVREDIERTYVYQDANLKIGRMVYTAREAIQDLGQFFLTQMPEHGWKLDSLQQSEGVSILFTKPDKRLDISITSQGVGRSQLLILNLTPASAGGGL